MYLPFFYCFHDDRRTKHIVDGLGEGYMAVFGQLPHMPVVGQTPDVQLPDGLSI